ncbi:MAG: VWA domain-containing protein [Ignavibacteriaceae bacterium]
MFRFAHPEYLNALYLLPVLVLLFWYLNRNRKKILEKFASRKLQRILISSYSRSKSWFKFGIIILSLALLILAAANPQVGTKMQEVKQTGIDVFILLDVSQSMNAQDIKPSRLEKAKYQISNLIRKLQGDRIGLIIFSGAAYIQIPLTTDYSAAGLFLNAVDVTSVPQPGTAIGPAVNLATESFDYRTSTQKVIVVITDGEDHEGDVIDAVNTAVTKGIQVYAIGLGSSQGVPIPVYNNQGKSAGFKLDNMGNTVLTKLDETTLQQIATAGNGKYFRGSNYEDELDLIYRDLSALEKTEFGVKKVTDYEDRFYYFLAPAILLLLLEFFISDKRSPLFTKLNKRLGIES